MVDLRISDLLDHLAMGFWTPSRRTRWQYFSHLPRSMAPTISSISPFSESRPCRQIIIVTTVKRYYGLHPVSKEISRKNSSPNIYLPMRTNHNRFWGIITQIGVMPSGNRSPNPLQRRRGIRATSSIPNSRARFDARPKPNSPTSLLFAPPLNSSTINRGAIGDSCWEPTNAYTRKTSEAFPDSGMSVIEPANFHFSNQGVPLSLDSHPLIGCPISADVSYILHGQTALQRWVI